MVRRYIFPGLLALGVFYGLLASGTHLHVFRAPPGAVFLPLAITGIALSLWGWHLLPQTAGVAVGFAIFAASMLAGVLLPPPLFWVPVGAVFLIYHSSRARLPESDAAAFWGWVFIWPALALTLVWNVFPSFFAMWISLFDRFNFINKSRFIGLLNYEILFRDPLFWKALSNTFWYVIITVPAGILLGTFIAVLLNERIRGLGLYRTVYFLPYITALTAAAAVWQWIYHPEFGFLNWLLGTPGLDWLHTPEGVFAIAMSHVGIEVSGFWAGPSVAFVAIMIMTVWHFLGYNVVILLAGLQSIPAHYYEAAELDGAGWWQKQRFITWPLLSPTTFFLAIIGLIGSFQVFTQVYVMTPTGGVLNDTLTVAMYLYNKGFRDSDFSYASALAVTMFVIILILTLVQRKLLERKVTYDQ